MRIVGHLSTTTDVDRERADAEYAKARLAEMKVEAATDAADEAAAAAIKPGDVAILDLILGW